MDKPKPFGQLQWRIDSTRRALYRALHALQQLEAAQVQPDPPAPDPPSLPHPPQTTSPQIGFVPSPPISAPSHPAPAAPHPPSTATSAAPSLQLDLVHQN